MRLNNIVKILPIALSVGIMTTSNLFGSVELKPFTPSQAKIDVKKLSWNNPKFKKHLAPVVWEGEYQAWTKDVPTASPKLVDWSRQQRETIYMPVKDKAYLLTGFQLASTLVVVGDDGLIVVDPGENDAAAKHSMDTWREVTKNKMPIKAVVYTHRHPDHPYGSRGLGVTQEDVTSGRTKIIAADNFMEYVINDTSVVGDIVGVRTAYSASIPQINKTGLVNPTGMINNALGPVYSLSQVSFYPPTDVVEDSEWFNIAGVKFEVFKAYGDAEDEIDLYFPKLKLVHGSETIQGETFPNMYTLRGTKYRDAVKWYNGVDELYDRVKKAEVYTASHMRAWVGNKFIKERVKNYRDAIQYVHDQSIYWINKGKKPAQLVELVKLPPKLANDPWLQELYGTVEHSTRGIYSGYIGWFEGDPTTLAEPTYEQKAKNYVKVIGYNKLIDSATKAINDKNYGWAMELLTNAVRANPKDTKAKKLKATAMRRWGYLQTNIYFRNLALSGANELDGNIPSTANFSFGNAEVLKRIDPYTILSNLRVKLIAKKALKLEGLTIQINIDKDVFTSTLRNGIAILSKGKTDHKPSATISMSRKVYLELVSAKFKQNFVAAAVKKGDIIIKGNKKDATKYYNAFDFNDKRPTKLVI